MVIAPRMEVRDFTAQWGLVGALTSILSISGRGRHFLSSPSPQDAGALEVPLPGSNGKGLLSRLTEQAVDRHLERQHLLELQ